MTRYATPRFLSRFSDRVTIAGTVAVCLVALLSFCWGVAAARYQIFPWTYVRFLWQIPDDLVAFVRGDVDERTTVLQKIMNDLDISPERHIRHYTVVNPSKFRELEVEGIRSRRDPPRLWMSSGVPHAYRMLIGAFDFDESFWGAMLLGPSGQIVKSWYMNGEIEKLTDQPDVLKDLYGVAFFPDGSTAFTMQEPSGGIIKVDVCSRVEWTKKGFFHHVIAPNEDHSAFWTFGGRQADLHPKLLLVNLANGETAKEIDMAEVAAVNPETFIFDLQRVARDRKHVTHPNDIEPLSTAMAKSFPNFVAGDLLISYQATNLIFVMNPDTLEVKWWYLGSGDGPHDPDWHEDGTISIYNNNYRLQSRGSPPFSTIVSVNSDADTHRTLIDGKKYQFYSRFNGNHQFTDYGTVLITSSTQGRVFEVDLATGAIVFDFVNAYDWNSRESLHLSDSFVVDEERSKRWASQLCSAERLPAEKEAGTR